MSYAAPGLKTDRDFVLVAVRENGYALGSASTEMRSDREVVLEAVRQNGHALGVACLELQADRQIVLAAVSENGLVLECAAPKLKMGSRDCHCCSGKQRRCSLPRGMGVSS